MLLSPPFVLSHETYLDFDPSGNLANQSLASFSVPQILSGPTTRIAQPGEPASFFVIMANAGPFAYQWRFNGTNLLAQTNDTLLRLNVGTTNQGGYSVVVTNSFGSVTSSVAQLYLDADRDGLPDSWEVTHFGNTTSQRSLGDPDNDGVSNYDEFWQGTNPNIASLNIFALSVESDGGFVAVSPAKSLYTNGEVVTLTATPFSPKQFYGWSGATNSQNNPQSLVMNGHKTIKAHFQGVPMPSGVVAWWRGQSNALDTVGMNHGTISNGVTYSTGGVETGFFFDGSATNQHIFVPASSSLHVGASSGMTIEAWVKPANLTNQLIIAEWGDGTSAGHRAYFMLNATSAGQLYVNLREANAANRIFFSAGNLLNTNTVQHVAFTYSKTGNARIFLNSVAVVNTSVGIFTPDTTRNLFLGYQRPGLATSFRGILDEVTIYNRALTSNEISDIHAAGPGGKSVNIPLFTSGAVLPFAPVHIAYGFQIETIFGNAPITFQLTSGGLPAGLTLSTNGLISGVPVSSSTNSFIVRATDALGFFAYQECSIAATEPSLPAGLVSWWRGETNATDWMGVNHGTLTNGVAFTNGVYGSCFLFDGTTGQSVKAVASTSLDVGNGGGLTLEGWIRPNSFTQQQAIAEWKTSPASGNSGVHFFHSTLSGGGAIGGLYANFIDTNSVNRIVVTPGNILSTNELQHVGFTYDRALAVARIFLNGEVVTNAVLGVITPRTVGDFNLGGIRTNAGFFSGQMDEMALYNRALTTNEMMQLAKNTPFMKAIAGPVFTSISPLSNAVVGQMFSQTFTTISGVAPVSFSVHTGTIPPGLNLNTNGILSGTPTNGGNFDFVVRATDAAGLTSRKPFSIEVFSATSPLPGIVAWWRAETNALDEIGTNHGTLTNGTTYANGYVGKAFSFDGTNDSVSVLDSPALRPTSLTVETWINMSAVSGHRQIVGKPVGTGIFNSYSLSALNGVPRAFVGNTNGNGTVAMPNVTLTTGLWYHLAFTYDGSSGMQSMFVDGVLKTNVVTDRIVEYDASSVMIGSDADSGTPLSFFRGHIDEPTIYNRALSAAEVAEIYAAGAAGKSKLGPYFLTPPTLGEIPVAQPYTQTLSSARATLPENYSLVGGTIPPGLTLSSSGSFSGTPTNVGDYSFTVRVTDATSLTDEQTFALSVVSPPTLAGLVGWWRAETNSLDAIANSDGVLTNGTTFAMGKVGSSFRFDGTNDTVEIPDVAAMHATSLTLEAWIIAEATNGTRQIFAKPFGAGALNTYSLYLTNGFLAGFVGDGISNGTVLTNFVPLSPGVWNHIAYTFDSSLQEQVLYVNGVNAATGNSTKFMELAYDSQPLILGADLQTNNRTFYFKGHIDEPAIYNRVLSGDEIAAIYDAGAMGRGVLGPYLNTPPVLQAGGLNQSYSQLLTSARAIGGVSYSLVAGALPVGLTLSTNGVISGLPTVAGGFAFTVRVTDSLNQFGEQQFTLNIVNTPTLAGLVGWWRAETNSLDAIANSDGELTNGTTFATGKVGSSFRFDGTNDTVEIPDVTAMHATALTLEAWIVAEATNGTRQIFAKPYGSGALNTYSLYLRNGFLAGFVGDGITNGTVLTNFIPLSPGVWNHIAYTFDPVVQEQALYVNGVIASAGNPTKTMNLAYDSQPLILGADLQTNNRTFYFKGRIDEPAIYNRVLSGDEIAAIYDAGALGRGALGPYLNTPPVLPGGGLNQNYSQTLTSARATGGVSYTLVAGALPSGLTLATNGIISGVPTVAGGFAFTVRVTDSINQFGEQQFILMINNTAEWPTGMVAWWRAETNALDSIGFNHGVLTNGTAFGAGKVGQAFAFDGVNDFVQIADATNLRPASLSLEAWIYPTATNGNRNIFAKPVGTAAFNSFGVYLANGVLRGYVGNSITNSTDVGAPTKLVPGRWYHIVYTFNHSTTQQVLYVDSLYAAGNLANRQIGYDGRPFLLGADINSGTPVSYFSGLIDEPTLYNRALTALEIKALYEADLAGKRHPTAFEQWSLQYFGSLTVSTTADPDADGFDNLSEFIADTVPTNAASLLRLTQVGALETNVWIEWQGGILATQYLQTSNDIGTTNTWTDIFTNLPPTPLLNIFTNTIGTNAARFYRIRVTR